MKNSNFFLILLLCCLILGGCASKAPEEMGQRLMITAEEAGIFGSAETPDGASSVHYSGLTNIRISCEGKWYSLEEALEQGLTTPEEMEAYARLDARNGFCTEEVTSDCGYAQYIYRYADFQVASIHDVFEAPDGSQYPMEKLTLAPADRKLELDFPQKLIDGEPVDLGREDWGVDFTVIQASAGGMTIQCSQSGGQHYGTLEIAAGYNLIDENGQEIYGSSAIWALDAEKQIPNGEAAEFTLDWSRPAGELPAGEYVLKIALEDVHGELTPMQKNYTDRQQYAIPFTVEAG